MRLLLVWFALIKLWHCW